MRYPVSTRLAVLCAFAAILITLHLAAIASAATIDINRYRFDPLIEEPLIPDDLRTTESQARTTYLLQFAGPVETIWKEEVISLGATFHGYIPENCFITRMSGLQRDAAYELPFVSWIGPYHIAYRISPQIGQIEYRSPERRDDPLLTLRVYVAEDRTSALEDAGKLGELLEVIEDPFQPGFVIHLDPNQVPALAAIDNVIWVEELPETFVFNNTTRWVVQSNSSGMTPIWSQGIHGEDQLVCMMDSGLDYNSCWFREIGNAPPGPTHRKVTDYEEWGGGNAYDGCGTGHGTHVAGTVVGDQSYINSGNYNYNGMAYGAKIMVQDVGSDGFFACLLGLISVPSSLSSALQDAYNHGALVHTNSWGSSSNSYDGYCVNIDSFMWGHKDFLVLFANGNFGPNGSTVGSPATAKNCVSVGATKQSPNQESVAGYSSRGPANDGRYKPTVTAPGGESPTYINSANNHTGDPPSATCNHQGSPFEGTSMATPAVAGCALLIRDYFAQGFYPDGFACDEPISPSAALVKAMLVNGGREMGGTNQPNNSEGWGRILLEDVLYFEGQSRELKIEDEPFGLATGEEIVYTYEIDSSDEPLEITLVWTDYAASQGANPALVNNLNLSVEAPDGTVYKGNVYSAGQSVTGGSADSRNVEECVQRFIPQVGVWTITVSAQNCPQGGHQPFALVSTGSFGNWPESLESYETDLPRPCIMLEPAQPNPFSASTSLAFTLNERGSARLSIFDGSGRLISTLVDTELPAGSHRYEWDGRLISGAESGSGIYFYRLETDETTITRKMSRLQ